MRDDFSDIDPGFDLQPFVIKERNFGSYSGAGIALFEKALKLAPLGL